MWYTGNGIKGSNPFDSATKIKRPKGRLIFVLRVAGMGQSAAHDQYADEQLQNMQKRIYLIRFQKSLKRYILINRFTK